MTSLSEKLTRKKQKMARGLWVLGLGESERAFDCVAGDKSADGWIIV